jgi:hypothetical protein
MKSQKHLSKVVVRVEAPGLDRNANTVCRAAILLLVWFASALAAPSPGYAAVRTVCARGCKYTTIAAAIAAAKAGDTISILDAVHTESNITVDRNLTIKGLGATITAVDGGGEFNDFETVFVIDLGVTVTIQDMTIRDSSRSGIVNNGTVTISNSTVSDNAAGGIENSGTVTISNSTISDNSSPCCGGIDNGGTMTISNSTVSDNNSAVGAGIDNGGTMTISNSTVSGNGGHGGGGIANFGFGTVTINDSTISGNSSFVSGAGIDNSGTATISNSTVSDNSTLGGGGGISNEGTATISFSTISGNSALDGGGGIATSVRRQSRTQLLLTVLTAAIAKER